MNKRQLKKKEKSINLNRHNIILSEVKKHFSIKSEVYLDGYFIFNMGYSQICHFELIEAPDWKFAIWLNEEGFSIFGEHKDLVDKFKPSRGYFCYNEVESFIDIANKISNNPKLYFVDSLTFGDALVAYEQYEGSDSYYGYQAVRVFYDNNDFVIVQDRTITQEVFVNREYDSYISQKKIDKQKEDDDRKKLFDTLKKIPNSIDGVLGIGIKDLNRNGIRSFPRYKVALLIDYKLGHIQKIDDEVFDFFKSENIRRDAYFAGYINRAKDLNYFDYKYRRDLNE